jgi:hypothetical protein
MAARQNPKHEPADPCTAEASDVLTLRDRFAIAALQGVLASHRDGMLPKGGFVIIAAGCYLAADAMIAARSRTNADAVIRAIKD